MLAGNWLEDTIGPNFFLPVRALDAGVASEQRYTIGTRLFGRHGPVDYNFEFIYQFGHFGGRPISAFAVFSDTGFTFASAWGKPRIAMKADAASGGNSRGTGNAGSCSARCSSTRS